MSKVSESSTISFSIRNGLYLPFMHKGRQIVVHNAAWSFREKIWVDDLLVVNQIGMTMASTHQLDVAGDRLSVTFGYRDYMREIFLEARVDEELIHEMTHRVRANVKPATFVATILAMVLAGAGFGYAVGHLVQRLIG
ncbi:MAG: hypothetical protein AB8B96_12290 [Lysobacterales bacterium]